MAEGLASEARGPATPLRPAAAGKASSGNKSKSKSKKWATPLADVDTDDVNAVQALIKRELEAS